MRDFLETLAMCVFWLIVYIAAFVFTSVALALMATVCAFVISWEIAESVIRETMSLVRRYGQHRRSTTS